MKKEKQNYHLGRLIGGIYRDWHFLNAKESKKLKLTRTEQDIILCLITKGNRLTQRFLSEFYRLDCAQLTRALNSLESKGYIRRIIDSDDKRNRLVELINPEADYAKAIIEINDNIYGSILAVLSDDEQTQLEEMLERICEVVANIRKNNSRN